MNDQSPRDYRPDWHQQRANQTNAGWLLGYVFVVGVIAVAVVGWWLGL